MIGYLAPDGTHYPCEAYGHNALARKITGIAPRTMLDVSDDGTFPPDAEEVLDRAGYVRIEARGTPHAVLSFGARWYDESARPTEAQRSWLRINGYGRELRELSAMHAAATAISDPGEL